MKKTVIFWTLSLLSLNAVAQNVGIGTTTPNASSLLHVDIGSSTTKGLLITGTATSGTFPNLGAGARLMFYPGKGAFRAGTVTGTEWDNANVGISSTALGINTTAVGDYSTSIGSSAIASGDFSTAIGYSTIASGISSTALGINSTASGGSSTAMGNSTTASGSVSTALGYFTTASGDYSFAAGRRVSTNNQTGSFFFGDSDPNNKGVRVSGVANEFAARFNGGYYFISSNAGASDIGVRVAPGGNSWSAISDIRRKENFLPVSGESILNRIAAFDLTTWNYKGQEKTFRHYGPMAQDFFAAFGKDELGTIGCDTLINQQDFLGINLIAIQALEKRTQRLSDENEELKSMNKALTIRLEKIEKLMNNITSTR